MARELGVSPELLPKWVFQSRAGAGLSGAGGDGPMTPAEREELRQLRRQIRELELEKEILRKAAEYSANELRSRLGPATPAQYCGRPAG